MQPVLPSSDLCEGELVHPAHLLHVNLEGVLIRVMLDDVVIHIHKDPDDKC